MLAFGILAVSSASLLIRYAQQEMPPLVIAALRMIFATLILAPLALARCRADLARIQRAEWGVLLLSGVFLAIHFAAWITSLGYTSVASSVVLVTTTPLWVALLTPLVSQERLNPWVWLGLAVTLLGGMIVGLNEVCSLSQRGLVCEGFSGFLRGRALWGNFLALLGAWMSAGYLLLGRRMRTHLPLTAYIFVVYGFAALTLFLAVLFSRQPLVGYSLRSYGWCLALAIFPQLLGHTSFNWGVRHLSATYVSISMLGEPIGSILLAYILLHEQPAAVEILGGGLILIGIILVSQIEKKRQS